MKTYIAYGSNMNVEQMRRRCPGAILEGTAELKDYEIVFRGNSHTGVANIEPKRDGSIPVVVWKITPEDEVNLDIYEGFPVLYTKKILTIEKNGKKRRGMAYIMTDGHRYQKPSVAYLETIANGYDHFGLDVTELFEAAVQSGIKGGLS